jgi:hypothetical protein
MHSLPSGRLRRNLRKQVILFVISVLLPALLLFVFIVRLNRQDIELRKTRAVEARQQKAEEIGRPPGGKTGEKGKDYSARTNIRYRQYPNCLSNPSGIDICWTDSEGRTPHALGGNQNKIYSL